MTIGTHCTTIETDGSTTRVFYHSTAVAVLDHARKVVRLNSGGYRTRTTAKRINQCLESWGLNCRVFQRDFAWYLGTAQPYYQNATPFTDGMELPL